MPDSCQLWEPKPLAGDRVLHWQIGPLGLWMRQVDHELWLAVERDPACEEAATVADAMAKPDGVAWERFALAAEVDQIRLLPQLADRAVVVRPEVGLTIPPGVDCTFYARVPLWIGVEVRHAGATVVVTALPTVILSNTWFGDDPMSGRLCFAMRTTARRHLQQIVSKRHRAICAIAVRNTGDQPLRCDRLCIDMRHLSLYERDGELWTSVVWITHRGSDAGQQIEYRAKAPDGAVLDRLVTPPREVVRGGIFEKSIGSFALGNLFRGL